MRYSIFDTPSFGNKYLLTVDESYYNRYRRQYHGAVNIVNFFLDLTIFNNFDIINVTANVHNDTYEYHCLYPIFLHRSPNH